MKPCQFRATMRTDKVLIAHHNTRAMQVVCSRRFACFPRAQSELKVYTFEARTAEEACEIVGKLQYCSKKMKEGKENVK